MELPKLEIYRYSPETFHVLFGHVQKYPEKLDLKALPAGVFIVRARRTTWSRRRIAINPSSMIKITIRAFFIL